MKEKFYVVAERINPQLGIYLSDVYVGTKRTNQRSISFTFDYFGSPRVIKFELHADPINHAHCDGGDDNCVYGSMAYYGFEKAEDARAYLERRWSKHYNFAKCVAKLAA